MSLLVAAVCAATALWPQGPVQAQGRVKFASPEAAFEQGMGAYRGGHIELAIPGLQVAADANNVVAQYYLARIYADNIGPHTNHAKAYALFQRIANDHADVDPDDDRRAPFVARSFVALAGYLLTGISEIGLKPNPVRSAELAGYAATWFNDEDAQFELAKLQLKGDGVRQDVKTAMHWFSVLTQKGHAGAQAFLADLYWRGKYVPRDPLMALSLITVAVENAPAGERIWIEDIYQNIFCGAPTGTRKQADGIVADWRQKFHRNAEPADRSGLAPMVARPVRTCANGETVSIEAAAGKAPPVAPGQTVPAPPAQPPLMQGTTGGFGLRDVGAPGGQRRP
jgi:hypothetical protein